VHDVDNDLVNLTESQKKARRSRNIALGARASGHSSCCSIIVTLVKFGRPMDRAEHEHDRRTKTT
jgi:hypothetical protein